MNLFIDTNIFLSFYHFSSDDLAELGKLGVLVRREKVNLLLPDQVVTEFRRNRANKIADALKRLRAQRLKLQFPQLCREYEEYDRLRECQREYQQHHAELIGRIEEDIAEESLKADVTIRELFELASSTATSSDMVGRARVRSEIGNPPGKRGSLGDAINWEALLETVPPGEALHFISDDKDYCSALDDDLFDAFLLDEWATVKKSELVFYKRLSSFFKKEFPDISLADELEKDGLIAQLGASESFRETHAVIRKLSAYSDFSHAQINDIVSAAVSNNQVNWIVGDPDVETFLQSVVHGREDRIDPDTLSVLRDLLLEAALEAASESEDEIPF